MLPKTRWLLAALVTLSPPAALADPPPTGDPEPPRRRPKPDEEDRNEDGEPRWPGRDGLPRSSERGIHLPLDLTLLAFREQTIRGASLGLGALLAIPLDGLAKGRLEPVGRTDALPDPRLLEPRADEPRMDEVRLPAREVRALVRAAWRAAHLSPEDEHLADLASRARSSAVLPELRVRVVRTTNESLALDPTQLDPTRDTSAGGASMLYELRTTWRLDRLLFDDDEVMLERVRAERNEQRLRLTMHVVEALTGWQRAHARAQERGLSPEEHSEALVREVVTSTTLDALTDGAWSSREGAPAGARR